MDNKIVERLLVKVGGKFSLELGIDLAKRDPVQINKWFLAAKLFGARIPTGIAARTFREFERSRVLTPETIVASGWDRLVEILDAGGYVRYDFSTASRLLAIMDNLTKLYGGDLNVLHERARDSADLERLLKQLGPGIGDVTVNIFLRELRMVWPKARPGLSPMALLASRDLGLIGPGNEPLLALESFWSKHSMAGRDFTDFEAALIRLGKDYCKKGRHAVCPFRDVCEKRRGEGLLRHEGI